MKIKKFSQINENITSNDSDVKTILISSEIDINGNITDIDDELYSDEFNTKCTIFWDYEFIRNDEIKPTIKKIVLEFTAEYYKHSNSDDTTHSDLEFIFTEENSEIIIDDKHNIDNTEYKRQVLPYYPSNIEFTKIEDDINILIKF